MEIRWLRKALENLDDHASFIANEDAAAAGRVIKRVHDALELLARNPAMGRPGRIDGTRELVISGTPLIIPYRVVPQLNRIEILRVFHSARRRPDSW